MNNIKNIAIIGIGGFSRELKYHIINKYKNVNVKIITDLKIHNYELLDDVLNQEYNFIIGLGDPIKKRIIYDKIIKKNIFTYIDDEQNLIDKNSINIKHGSVICKGAVLTTNINLGVCSHINLNSTIGHDVDIGNFFTCSPGVNISGKCKIGNNVFIGTNSSIKEDITIVDDVIIGMNSNVIKNIDTPGVYVGNPLKKIK